MIPTASSVPIPQFVYHTAPEATPTVGIPINDPRHLQAGNFHQYQEVCPISASVPGPMSTSMPISIPHHGYHQQRQQIPYPPVYGAAPPDLIGRGRVPKACESCKFRKVKCSGTRPCERCAGRALRCVYGERKVRGPTKKRREKRDTAIRRVSSSFPAVSFFFVFSSWGSC